MTPQPRTFFHLVASNTAILSAANAVARSLSIITAPILTRLLSPVAYGAAALVGSLASFVGALTLLGLEPAYTRLYWSSREDHRDAFEALVWSVVAANSLISGTSVAAIWVLLLSRPTGASSELGSFVFVIIVLSSLSTLAQARSRIRGRYRHQGVGIVASATAGAIVSIGYARFVRPDATALLFGTVTSTLTLLFFLGIPRLGQFLKVFELSGDERTTLFSFAIANAISPPLFLVISSADRWVLALFRTAHDVGVYALTYNLAVVGLAFTSGLSPVWLAEVARLQENPTDESRHAIGITWQRLFAIQAGILVGVATFGGDFIRIITPQIFHGGVGIVPWIALAYFFYGLYHLSTTGMYISGRMKMVSFWWVVGALLSLGLNFVLVPRFGMRGAAITQCVAFGVITGGSFMSSTRHFYIPLDATRLAASVTLTLVALVGLSPGYSVSPIISILVKIPLYLLFDGILAVLFFRTYLISFLVARASSSDGPRMEL